MIYSIKNISKYHPVFIVVATTAIGMLAFAFFVILVWPALLDSITEDFALYYMLVYMALMGVTMWLSYRLVYCKTCGSKITVRKISMDAIIFDGLVQNGSVKQPILYQRMKQSGKSEWDVHVHECTSCNTRHVVSANPKNWG